MIIVIILLNYYAKEIKKKGCNQFKIIDYKNTYMKIKNKKLLNRKKMTLTVIYGIIFLISTMAFYFVNTSKAQNVQNIKIGVIDQNLELDEVYYQEKLSENEDGTYKISLPSSQNEFLVNSYYLITDDELNNILKAKKAEESNDKNLNEIQEKTISENNEFQENTTSENNEINKNNETDKNNKITDIKKDATIEKENNEKITNTIDETNTAEETNILKETNTIIKTDTKVEQNVNNQEKETIEKKQSAKEIVEKIRKNSVKLSPETEYEVTSYIKNKKPFYLIAEYQKKEKKDEVVYNKKISYTTEKNEISITGFMPKNANIKVKEVDKTAVENQISKENGKNIKLQVAYDIKILIDEKEYEPEDLGEEVTVEIKGINGEIVRIWHIKDKSKTEEIISKIENDNIIFKTASFSIYGVEVVEDETNSSIKEEILEQQNENQQLNIEQEDNLQQQENSIEQNLNNGNIKSAPLRAPASTAPDSTLIIDDYDSDYYYYKGKNYTDDISGTNQGIYNDSDLVKVTLNYYGFAQGETHNEKKGRISLTETHDIVQNIKCVPKSGNNVTIELMENPFMDKPTGYGFGGWTPSLGTVNKNTQNLTYTLSAQVSGETTINLYANWVQATVVYLNPDLGNDNLYNGLSEETPFGSWGKAFQYINSNSVSRTDRERNIIVLTGNIDSSINYTRAVTGTRTIEYDVTYNVNNTITSGIQYIISTGTGNGSNAISTYTLLLTSGITNETISTSELPENSNKWVITKTTNGYSIKNVSTNTYLGYNQGVFGIGAGITLQNTSFDWQYSNHKLYFTRNGSTYYLNYNNSWGVTTNSNSASNLNLLTYTYIQNEIVTNSKDNNISSNSNYTSSTNSAVTITSLYNHTDYRQNATIALTSSDYFNFNIYNSFQMNHLKINATGYTSNSGGTTFNDSYPWLIGRLNNIRLGRGLQCANTSSDGTIFANVIGDGRTDNNTTGSTTNDNNSYKLIVESGRYSSIIGQNYGSSSKKPVNSYYGTIYLTLGNDIDRKSKNNNNLSVYYRTTVNAGYGYVGKSNVDDKAFLINVKSGTFGEDFFIENDGDTTTNSAYAGIYVGGFGWLSNGNTYYYDYSDRYCIVEGGKIVNLIGGLRTNTSRSVETRMYVKGGDIYNIVGGAGNSTTYCDRLIQVTGGEIRYAVSGGSNGYKGESGDGEINTCQTLVYIGGDAKIGTQDITSTLFGINAGCVLGAGNGNSTYADSGAGKVDSTHIIVNDNAVISNSVYGGGNYGCVGSGTSGISLIDILGGTIDKNVYGGSNNNSIYGSTLINIKNGQVKGAVYGGSNTSGTVSTSTTINVTGGKLGQSTTPSNAVLFGGGYGAGTTITQDTTLNILDTFGNVEIYGNVYGGSAQGTINGNTLINIQDLPSTTNTISITGNVFAGGQGTSSQQATINGSSTINVNGSNILNASIFGGNDINGVTNGNITVNIGQDYESKVGRVYGGGNEDATGTEADSVNVYLFPHANVQYAFNGGKSADFTTAGAQDQNRGIYLKGGHADNIFGGSDSSGDVNVSHVYIESGTATNVYGGNNEGGQTSESLVNVTGGSITNVFGGGYQASTITTNVNLTGGVIINAFGGGNAASVTTANILLNGARAANVYGGSNSAGTVNTSNVTITSGTVTNVYGGNNAGGNTVNTNVIVNSPATNVFGGGNQAQTSGNTQVYLTSTVDNIYGGGNEAITSGNTYVKLTNARVNTNAYGGGNGQAAVVVGNSTIIVEGETSIGGDLFGGGNAAANGIENNDNSEVRVLITGGTISGDVYGAANTSVVYGNTYVKIGSQAVNDNTFTKKSINISGTVFGGGKSNNAGSENYDFTFESVTQDVFIDINANGYDNGTDLFKISGSVFGSGNAAKISGNGYINITDYGTTSNIKQNVSIQRATKVIIDNSNIYLAGTTDRTNEIATAKYTFNRINDLVIKNNTKLYLQNGVNITSKLESLTASDVKAQVIITEEGGITGSNVDNRIYLSQGRNIILKTEEGTNGEVYGMTYIGLFVDEDYSKLGIYKLENYQDGDTIVTADSEMFTRNSYVQGKHYYSNGVSSHDIEVDGFYTNYDDEGIINTAYINPTPENADSDHFYYGRFLF